MPNVCTCPNGLGTADAYRLGLGGRTQRELLQPSECHASFPRMESVEASCKVRTEYGISVKYLGKQSNTALSTKQEGAAYISET
jgi:hypothetical protein